MIGITEPRRVAAISMAARVAHELNLTQEYVHRSFTISSTIFPLGKSPIRSVMKVLLKKKQPVSNS